jgi:hypothetical protein
LIRFLNAVPGLGPVDIYLNGSLFFNRVFFTQFTPYLYVPSGSYEIAIFPTMKKENPIIRDFIQVGNNELGTLSLNGFDDLGLLFIPEAKNDVDNDNSKLRVVHLSPNIPKVNIIINNEVLFEDIDFKEATNYMNLPPDIYRIDIELSQNNRLLRSNRVRINPDGIYSLYMLGNFANFQLFRSLDGGAFITPVIRN